MEKEEFLPDDLLKDLFRTESWESPGKGFTDDVMKKVLQASGVVREKRSFSFVLRTTWPYILLAVFSVVFLMTSDIPFTDYIPGKGYFIKNLLPYLRSLFSGFESLFLNVKTISIPLMVVIAGGLLVGFDHFLFRKPGVRHQTSR